MGTGLWAEQDGCGGMVGAFNLRAYDQQQHPKLAASCAADFSARSTNGGELEGLDQFLLIKEVPGSHQGGCRIHYQHGPRGNDPGF